MLQETFSESLDIFTDSTGVAYRQGGSCRNARGLVDTEVQEQDNARYICLQLTMAM